ncbi:MAG: IPT/TIG domain-containing protein, partial [bacterium]|nr:IPT/TIG domain-containing protein [bacterium]
TVKFGANTSIKQVAADTSGSFTTTFTVDTQKYGTTTISATGASSTTATASTTFFILPQVYSVTPTSGSVGTIVTVNGTGYAAGDSITVKFGANTSIKQVAADASGSFTTTFTVDTQKYGTTTISATGASSTTATASTTFFIQHDIIYVSPTSGTVGAMVAVYSTGYAANGTITIDFGTNTNIQQATATANGSFSCTFTIPLHIYGTETITATYDGGAGSGTAIFFVMPNITNILPISGTVGASINISGNGYIGGLIKIYLGTISAGYLPAGITANSAGTFTGVFTINTQSYGTVTVIARSLVSPYYPKSESSLVVLPSIYIVSPSQGTVGATITISGNGFIANSPGTITFGPGNNFRATFPSNTSGSGTFTNITFTVDAQVFGTTTVIATTGDVVGTGSFKILANIKPLSPTTGTVGSLVTINGFGFAQGVVSIDFGGEVTTATANNNGSFTKSFAVPPVPGITAVVQATRLESMGTDTYTIIPRIYSVNPSQGSIGTLITVKGDGLGANDNVTVNFGAVSASSTTASSKGTWTCVFTAPAQAYGTTTIIAIGAATETTGAYVGTFSVQPHIYEISPTTGTIGTPVIVKGSGFSATTTGTVRVGVEDRGTFSTFAAGTFTSTFTVDSHAYGSNTVTATDVNSISYAKIEGFIMRPSIKVLPATEYVGNAITVSGEGFGSTETIAINFGAVKTIATCTTGANGAFQVSFSVAEQPATITITAIGTVTNASTGTPFYVISKIVGISPNSGTIGTVIEIKGQGYAASELLWVYFGTDINPYQPSPLTANSSGTFAVNFTTVSQPYGTQTVRVKGSTSGREASGIFSVKSIITMITPSIGTVGSRLTISGTGFGSSTNRGTITFGQTSAWGTFTPSNNGTFSVAFSVDAQIYGTKTIIAFDTSNASGTVTGSFTLIPSLKVTPTMGTIGASIVVDGWGYGNENVKIKLGDTPTIATGTANANGTFSVGFTVDLQYQQDPATIIKGTGENTGASATTSFKIQIQITSLNPIQGSIGSTVSVQGNGASYDTQGGNGAIQYIFGNATDYSSINSNGTFDFNFVVDTQIGGVTNLRITDNSGGGGEDYADKIFTILPNIWVSPTIGTVGTLVTVEGNGYKAETISIYFADTFMTSTTSSALGTFSTTFSINNRPYGVREVKAGAISGTKTTNLNVDCNITTVNPLSGTVGSLVIVEGTGFGGSGGPNVMINFGTTNKIGTVNANLTTGTFSITFSVDTQAATTTITALRVNALDNAIGGTATSTFTVKGKITSLSPSTGTIGTMITLQGNGWAKNEQIVIDFGITLTRSTVNASDYGTFSCLFTVNSQPAGYTTITARGQVSGATWTLSGAETFQIKGNVGVTPTTGTVGSMVTVNGNGFKPADSVEINFGNTVTIAAAISNSAGTWTVSFTVDTQCYGTTTIRAYGQGSGWAEDGTFSISGEIIRVSPNIGIIGTEIIIEGNGFGASELVKIDFGTHINIVQGTASGVGTFSAVFTVDKQGYGLTTITATGLTSQTIGTDTFTIGPRILSVSPKNGTVGIVVSISGDGYGASESVSILFGNTGNASTVTTITAQVNGEFSGTFTVMNKPYGTTSVVAKGVSSANAYDWFKVLPAVLQVSPINGSVGQVIAVLGTGYASGEQSSIGVKLGDMPQPNVSAGIDSLTGNLTGTFTVGTQSGGQKVITVTGNSSGAATNTFSVLANIYLLNPASGTVGASLEIRGSGYTGTDSTISVSFGGVSAGSITAGIDGEFIHYINVLTQVYGTRTVEAIDQHGQTANKPFSIIQKITSISPTLGTVGRVITVSGNGYPAGQVEFYIESSKRTAQNNTVNSNGIFTSTFTIDEQCYETKTISAGSTVIGLTYVKDYGTISISANIVSITPSSGTIGSYVTMRGSGFEALQGITTLVFGSKTFTAATTTTSGGTFTLTFTVPTNEGATTTVTATGAVATASTIFTVQGRVTYVTPLSGTVGSPVTVSGDGYKKGENVRIDFGTSKSFSTPIDAYGRFENVTFTVNTQVYGTTTINVTGQTSGLMAATGTYKILSGLVATPDNGTVGTMINLLGTGFG